MRDVQVQTEGAVLVDVVALDVDGYGVLDRTLRVLLHTFLRAHGGASLKVRPIVLESLGHFLSILRYLIESLVFSFLKVHKKKCFLIQATLT